MTTDKNKNKRPDFTAYHVKDIGKEKPTWTKLGAAWKHADGEGINIVLDSLPIDGRISLRVPKPSEQEPEVQ